MLYTETEHTFMWQQQQQQKLIHDLGGGGTNLHAAMS